MNFENIEYLRKWYKNYVKKFYGEDDYINENVALKEHHSRRVCNHCMAIADSLKLPEDKKYLAEAAGLYHDIGRFEQFERYKTFNDKNSENHGQLGAKILQREKCLDPLDHSDQLIILKCVQNHGLKDLPANEDEETLVYLKMVRDGDKLDILKVLTDYYSSTNNGNNPALDLDLPDVPVITPAVIQELMENKCVNLKHIKTIYDFRLLQTSWIYDLNFTYSMKYVKKEMYIDKLFNHLPQTDEIQQVYAHINQSLP